MLSQCLRSWFGHCNVFTVFAFLVLSFQCFHSVCVPGLVIAMFSQCLRWSLQCFHSVCVPGFVIAMFSQCLRSWFGHCNVFTLSAFPVWSLQCFHSVCIPGFVMQCFHSVCVPGFVNCNVCFFAIKTILAGRRKEQGKKASIDCGE